MINGIGIVGFRDPNGIRPLVFGTREKTKVDGATKDYVVSSESVVMDMLGFQLSRENFLLFADWCLLLCLVYVLLGAVSPVDNPVRCSTVVWHGIVQDSSTGQDWTVYRGSFTEQHSRRNRSM